MMILIAQYAFWCAYALVGLGLAIELDQIIAQVGILGGALMAISFCLSGRLSWWLVFESGLIFESWVVL